MIAEREGDEGLARGPLERIEPARSLADALLPGREFDEAPGRQRIAVGWRFTASQYGTNPAALGDWERPSRPEERVAPAVQNDDIDSGRSV